ncbi:peptide ABC transporter substrate-binding protein [Clostridium sp. LBM24168]
MRKFIYLIIATILISIVIVILSGISVEKKVRQTDSNDYQNSIVYNINDFPKDLIMLSSYNIQEKDVLSNLFDGLVSIDEDGNIVPDLAEKWDVSQDKTQYTFTIRNNAKWSNGEDITAEDFVDFFSHILNKKLKNIYSNQLNCIFGVEKYRKDNGDFENVAIKALNRKTLQIRLNYSSDYFLNIMAQPIYSLRKIDDDLFNWKKRYNDIAYSGSFKIDKISDEGYIEMKRNDKYWNKNNVKNSKIVITSFPSSESALAAFQNNKVNVFTNPPISEIKNIENVSVVPTYGGEALVFNIKKQGILDNEYFRKSIALSIDRKNIVQNILKNKVDAASVYIPYNSKINLVDLIAQKKEAEKFMDKANYQYNGVPLKIIYMNTVENKKICDSIAKNIKSTFNIEVKCYGYDKDNFENELKGKNYDIAEINYRGNYYYPMELLNNFESRSKLNFGGYASTEFDTKMLQATFENDGSKRLDDLKEAESILLDDNAIIPLYFDNTIICVKNYVKGVYLNKLGNVKLDKAYLSK